MFLLKHIQHYIAHITIGFCLFAALLFSSPPAYAWQEASSDHFLIYAKHSEKRILRFAKRLERYHAAMMYFYGFNPEPPSPSNRLTIYVAKSEAEVRTLYGKNSRYVQGFYLPGAGDSLTVIAPLRSNGGKLSSSEQVLLHEYAHHIMWNFSQRSYPRWVTEGFAEFFSSARFEKNGDIGLGLPAYHRGYELEASKNVPIELLLDSELYFKNKGKQYDNFYGRSWLLFHYLQFSEQRKQQLNQYLRLIIDGTSEIDAAKQVFGDLEQLDAELDDYRERKQLRYMPIKAETLSVGEVTVRKLSKGEAAVLPIQTKLTVGFYGDQAEEQKASAMAKLQKLVQKYPEEAKVFEALSQLQLQREQYADAIAAAEQAIKLDAQSVTAQLHKANAMASQAQQNEVSSTQVWGDIRREFIKANKIEHDHPVPLTRFYESYLYQNSQPTDNAIASVKRALELAPYDPRIRILVAHQYLENKQFQDAIATLKPLAHSPHQNSQTRRARKLMQEVIEAIAFIDQLPAEEG